MHATCIVAPVCQMPYADVHCIRRHLYDFVPVRRCFLRRKPGTISREYGVTNALDGPKPSVGGMGDGARVAAAETPEAGNAARRMHDLEAGLADRDATIVLLRKRQKKLRV